MYHRFPDFQGVGEMGRCQRGVHFGAVGLKRDEESTKFPIAKFSLTFLFLRVPTR
jgi:hypothetical protein